MDEFVPRFRVHIALSAMRDEAIFAAQLKYADSPYPETDPGYHWGDFEPVSVLALTNNDLSLGERLKALLEMSNIHYRAPATGMLQAEQILRKQFLMTLFGEPDSRLVAGKFVDRSRAFMASQSPDLRTFWEEHQHFIAEDCGYGDIRIGGIRDFWQSEKTCEMSPLVHVSLATSPESLWACLRTLSSAA
jgi:hypothetical protein